MTGFPAIEELLPQRAPMILLDSVIDDADGWIRCAATPRHDSPVARDGAVPGIVAFEYMAQCVAAYAGMRAHSDGRPVRIGYIIGARQTTIYVDSLDVDVQLVVKARRVWGDDSLGHFECGVDRHERSIAVAAMNVFQGDIDRFEAERTVGR